MPQNKREYGLQKKIIPQVRYRRKLKKGKLIISEEIKERVQYYERKKGVIKTVIYCNPKQIGRLNCQHYFMHQNFLYTFSHSDTDLKDWQELQQYLIKKVQSWEFE